ncbi:MAG: hypothetical protein ACFFCE_04435 [Promethearchaeota archaeon]
MIRKKFTKLQTIEKSTHEFIAQKPDDPKHAKIFLKSILNFIC